LAVPAGWVWMVFLRALASPPGNFISGKLDVDLVLDLDLDQTRVVKRGSIKGAVQVQDPVQVEVQDCIPDRVLKVSDRQ
jgi:hypothetical protein